MSLKKLLLGAICCGIAPFCFSQLNWKNVDTLYGPLPASMHVFRSADSIDGKPSIAYYVSADLSDRSIQFTAAAEDYKKLTPTQYYQQLAAPLVVVNCTFFNVATGQNMNTVIRDGRTLSYNPAPVKGSGRDSVRRYNVFKSAIGITDDRKADVAWLKTDSARGIVTASQVAVAAAPVNLSPLDSLRSQRRAFSRNQRAINKKFKTWNMQTAVGGGPVLVQHADTLIANNEEMRFAGKARFDKHPRTAMGYTADGKLIILAIQGRFPALAEGATLVQEARILRDIGCVEALNLDGGGSTCLLVNGKETVTPSDNVGQRAVPAVFIIAKGEAVSR